MRGCSGCGTGGKEDAVLEPSQLEFTFAKVRPAPSAYPYCAPAPA